MKLRNSVLALALTAALALTGCAGPSAPAGPGTASGSGQGTGEDTLTVLATTYPVYLFASAVTEGVEGVEVVRLNTGNISCLHDYTLSVDDMKLIEGADLVAINGVGMETFMEDALAAAQCEVIDCSEGVELLENLAHHHEEGDEHDHGHYDPHIWMDPENGETMVENLTAALMAADPGHGEQYRANGERAEEVLDALEDAMEDLFDQSASAITGLITFHDGFQYFAHAFDLPLLAAIEEEAGSEASAKEINHISDIVKQKNIPVIFTEANGSDATAQAIARETGCAVGELSMLMSGEGSDLSAYADGMMDNAAAVIGGFTGNQDVSAG